ncbi:MAG: T9SS type A sorting domain-containing protein [bacterium]|nr:T9SS type A sorting domain-containing protein [Candidatus Kapabacteria bacterium]
MRTTLIILVLLATLLAPTSLRAHDEPIVLYIGQLDADTYRDTITGVVTGDLRMLPVAIHWGATPDTTRRLLAEDASDDRYKRTELRYPYGDSTVGSFALEDVNIDGIADIVLFYTNERGDSTHIVAIVGQRALRDIPIIDLATITRGIQWHPFIAIDLTSVDLFREGAMREHSGAMSYSWGSIPIPARQSDERGSVAPTLGQWLQLFPNPASTQATFEAGRLSRGEYTIEVIDVNGSVESSSSIVVEAEQPLSGTVDLSAQAAGLYLVRIRSADRTVATYPVVVVR